MPKWDFSIKWVNSIRETEGTEVETKEEKYLYLKMAWTYTVQKLDISAAYRHIV